MAGANDSTSKNNTLIIAGFLIVLVFLIAGAVYYAFRLRGGDTNEQQQVTQREVADGVVENVELNQGPDAIETQDITQIEVGEYYKKAVYQGVNEDVIEVLMNGESVVYSAKSDFKLFCSSQDLATIETLDITLINLVKPTQASDVDNYIDSGSNILIVDSNTPNANYADGVVVNSPECPSTQPPNTF